MINWPISLIREIAERRVIFFVGAGISRAATVGNANFPTWTILLNSLTDRIEKKSDKN